MQSFSLLRKLDQFPFPYDLQQKLKRTDNITAFNNERTMIEVFVSKLFQLDPDLLIAHNLCGSAIEILLARINYLKIQHWSRIGRMKRSMMPNRKADGNSGSWVPRQVSCGRLLVDTFLNAKELIRETSYELGTLAKTQLKLGRTDYDEDMLPNLYKNSDRLLELVNHTEQDALITYKLMMHL